jgi:hypothetical protein
MESHAMGKTLEASGIPGPKREWGDHDCSEPRPFCKKPSQMPFIQRNHEIQAFSPGDAD